MPESRGRCLQTCLWCMGAPAWPLNPLTGFLSEWSRSPPSYHLRGCSGVMLHWLSQPCLTVLLGEAAEGFESFSNISGRKPTLQACFHSSQLQVRCREIVFVALHLTPQVFSFPNTCLPSLSFLLCPGSPQDCPASV